MTQRTSRTALRALAAAMMFAAGIPAVHAQTATNPPATGVTITSSVASPQLVGTPVTFTASGTGSIGYQYRFFITTAGSGVYTMVQDYGAAATWTMPATTAAGAYQVIVHVRTTTTVPFDAQAGVDFTISSVPAATGVTIASSLPSPQVVGTPVTFTAAGIGSAGYQYRFWLTTAGSGVFTLVQDYGVGASWT